MLRGTRLPGAGGADNRARSVVKKLTKCTVQYHVVVFSGKWCQEFKSALASASIGAGSVSTQKSMHLVPIAAAPASNTLLR